MSGADGEGVGQLRKGRHILGGRTLRGGESEKAFIDQLQAALQVDDATALKIVDVLLIKSRA